MHLLAEGEPLETWGAEVMPDGFIWKNTPHHILEVANRWRVHTRWWKPRETVWREYVKVVTDMGLLCLIYRDLREGGWFLSRLYDRPKRVFAAAELRESAGLCLENLTSPCLGHEPQTG